MIENIEDDITQDLADMLTADSEVVTDQVQFEPDSPHWSVNRDDLLKLLRVVQSFPAKSTTFLALQKQGNELFVHANNKDAFVDARLPLLNDSPYETERVYFVDAKMLQTFAQNYPSFCLSFDENGNIIFESPYSVYQLETFNLSFDDIRISPEENLQWKGYPLTRQQTMVFKTLFGFAPSMTDNKVIVKQDKIVANFTLYQHSVESNTGADEDFIIRRIDIPTLAEITSDECEYAVTDKRIYFKFRLGLVSFLKLPYNAKEIIMPDTYATGEPAGEFQMDIKMLRRALKLTGVLSSPTVDFVQEGENIVLFAGTRAKFQVGKGEIKDTFTLSTELFSKIIATIDANEVFVTCKVAEKGIDVVIEKDKLVTYSMSRTSVGTLKRKEKINNKLERRADRKAAMAEKGTLAENQADKVDDLGDFLNNIDI